MSKRQLDPTGAVPDAPVEDVAQPKKRKSRFSSGPSGDGADGSAPVGGGGAAVGVPTVAAGVAGLPPAIDPNVLRAVQEATARAAAIGVGAGPSLTGFGGLGAVGAAGVGAGNGLPPSIIPVAVPLVAAPVLPPPVPTAGFGMPPGIGGIGSGSVLPSIPGMISGAGAQALSHISSQIAESLAKLRAAKDAAKQPAANAKGAAPAEVYNPYLAHRMPAPAVPVAASVAAPVDAVAAAAAAVLVKADDAPTVTPEVAPLPPGVDPRLRASSRRNRDKRAFHFIKEGSIVQEAEHMREKEALNNIIATTRGLGSRRRPTKHSDGTGGEVGEEGTKDTTLGNGVNPNLITVGGVEVRGVLGVRVPPRPIADRPVPDVEWWDSAFLPSEKRKSRAAAGVSVLSCVCDCLSTAGHLVALAWAGRACFASLCAVHAGVTVPTTRPRDQRACACVCVHMYVCGLMLFWCPETSLQMRGGLNTSKPVFEAELAASYAELALSNSKTVQYVEHPVPIQPAIDLNAPRAMPLMLTKKERKRIRRQRRAEREKEKQDKVRLGLLPPPAPKVKISNLMRVLGTEAVADPTKIENEVRKQMEERQRNHDMRNLARKLTPEERKEKLRRKNLKGMEDGIHVALFRVRDLSDKQHRFKVEVNAQESMLTGCVVICKSAGTNLVVVEGGTWWVFSDGVSSVVRSAVYGSTLRWLLCHCGCMQRRRPSSATSVL